MLYNAFPEPSQSFRSMIHLSSVKVIFGHILKGNDPRQQGQIKEAFISYHLQEVTFTPPLKYVSKVRGQLCDSRKLYIASVTVIQRAGNSMPQIKYAKKYRKLFIGVDTDALWWSFLAIILIHIHQT